MKTNENLEKNKLEKKLCREVTRAISDFSMIEENDKIMVCMSGGKDSFTLLNILLKLQTRSLIKFELVAVNLDQKQPGFPEHILPEYLEKIGINFRIENQDTYSVVKRIIPEGKTTCGLCSRLRRGVLYRVASELNCTKIALGHHRDDILQTLLLNMFYGGRIKGMPPKLVSDDGKHLVIRPMAYVRERDIIKWSDYQNFPIIPCNLCGSQDGLKRVEIKKMLQKWENQYPKRVENMFKSMSKIVPTHMLDSELYDFKNAKTTGEFNKAGDIAFDSSLDSEEFNSSSIINFLE